MLAKQFVLSPLTSTRPHLKGRRATHVLRAENSRDLALEWCAPVILASSLVFFHPEGASAASHVHEGTKQVAMELYRIADNEDFWANMARYSRFFVSVIAGGIYVILRPFIRLLKKPVTAAVVIGLVVVLFFFFKATLNAMLGLDDLPV